MAMLDNHRRLAFGADKLDSKEDDLAAALDSNNELTQISSITNAENEKLLSIIERQQVVAVCSCRSCVALTTPFWIFVQGDINTLRETIQVELEAKDAEVARLEAEVGSAQRRDERRRAELEMYVC